MYEFSHSVDLWHLQVRHRMFIVNLWLRARDCSRAACFLFSNVIDEPRYFSYSFDKHCVKFHFLSISSLCSLFSGADTEFLVQLWLFYRYDIHIGYPRTATYWLSGTRSCGKYFPMYSNYFCLLVCCVAFIFVHSIRVFFPLVLEIPI